MKDYRPLRKAGLQCGPGWKVAGVVGALLVFSAASSALARGAGSSAQQEVVVHLNRSVESKTMGLGVQWDPYDYPASEQDWKVILQRVGFMHPGFLRVMGRDETALGADPGILSWAQRHHSKVILGTWWPSPLAGSPNGWHPKSVPGWAQRVASEVANLRRKGGFTCIRYYNFANEPERVPIAHWAALAMALHAAFRRAGLADKVKIIGPDTYGDPGKGPGENFPLLPQVAQHASGVVGLYDNHWYSKDDEVYNGVIESALIREKRLVESLDSSALHKPFLMSEAGLIQGKCNGDQQPRVKTFTYGVMMADYAAQVFRAGWSGISAWDLDDAMHIVNRQPHTEPPGKLTLKIWGFWNSQGAAMGNPADFNIRPWFYTWSLMSRLFPASARVVQADGPAGVRRFRTLAGTYLANGRIMIGVMLVNNQDQMRRIVVRIPADTHAATFTEYRYFQHDRPVDSQGFPVSAATLRGAVPAKGLVVTMPGRGVVFLTNRALGER